VDVVSTRDAVLIARHGQISGTTDVAEVSRTQGHQDDRRAIDHRLDSSLRSPRSRRCGRASSCRSGRTNAMGPAAPFPPSTRCWRSLTPSRARPAARSGSAGDQAPDVLRSLGLPLEPPRCSRRWRGAASARGRLQCRQHPVVRACQPQLLRPQTPLRLVLLLEATADVSPARLAEVRKFADGMANPRLVVPPPPGRVPCANQPPWLPTPMRRGCWCTSGLRNRPAFSLPATAAIGQGIPAVRRTRRGRHLRRLPRRRGRGAAPPSMTQETAGLGLDRFLRPRRRHAAAECQFLCLDCDGRHDEGAHPICASESFALIWQRWVPASERRGGQRPPDAEVNNRETVNTKTRELLSASEQSRLSAWQLVRGGAVSLAVLGAAALALRHAAPHRPRASHRRRRRRRRPAPATATPQQPGPGPRSRAMPMPRYVGRGCPRADPASQQLHQRTHARQRIETADPRDVSAARAAQAPAR
jgi:hypothetical protein